MLLASFLSLIGIDSNSYVTCNPSIKIRKNSIEVECDVCGKNGKEINVCGVCNRDFFTVKITLYIDGRDNNAYFSFYDVNDSRFYLEIKRTKGNETIEALSNVLRSNIAWVSVG